MRKKRYPEAIIFDYDGTLVKLNIDFESMRRDVEAAMNGYGILPDRLQGLHILEMIDRVRELISKRDPILSATFFQKAHKMVENHEIRAASEGERIRGVNQMLVKLRQAGIKTGIITRNCGRAVRMTFPHIEEVCDAFVPRDDISRVKPHPDHLASVLKLLAVNKPSRCFMVGDHILDIETGKSMSMKTIGVLTGRTTREQFIEAGADLVFEDATQVFRALQEGQAS